MHGNGKMLRKVVFRLLVVIATSWLFPNTAGANDFGHGFPVGNWGNGIRPYVKVSSQDGRLSAVFSVVITTPRSAVEQSRENRQQDSTSGGRDQGDRQSPSVQYGP